MSNVSLRVLQIEDREQDVALMTRHLTQAGYVLTTRRVETAESLKSALASQEWDVALCDYSMPRFNALGALQVLKEMNLDIPFIVISGTVGETVAVEAMRSGAHDYIMKGNLTRLVPTIKREMQEAENRRARKRAEELLKVSEAELSVLFATLTDIVMVFDRDGRYLKVAPTSSTLLYKAPSELLGKTVHQVLSKGEADFFVAHIRRTLDEGLMHRTEYSMAVGGGREVWFDCSVSPMTTDSVVWIGRDVTDRKHSEHELRKSEERYRVMVENAHDIIYEHDLEGKYTSSNKAGEQITGYTLSESLHLKMEDIVAPECLNNARQMIRRKLAGQSITAYELEIIAKDGRRIAIEVNTSLVLQDGTPVGVQGIARDVTERRQLEERLRQSHKMEAIGQLAGGVAHDFNNLLTVIGGYSSILLGKLPADSPHRASIEEIKKASDRASSLTRQLLAFSRKQILQPKILNLNVVVSDLDKMLRRLISEDIDLLTITDPLLATVKADPGQIEQVLLNLVVNAEDAMPNGGKLTIETSNATLSNDYARLHGIPAGQYIMLAVTDTGCGMDAATEKRIFDPFFTTKTAGKGTGLGLATLYGIVSQSGGNVRVYSEVGHGTTFKIYLPRAVDFTESSESPGLKPTPLGTETVLLVEDDDQVRAILRQILENQGYHVLSASHGEEALAIAQEPGDIELMITDVVMPQRAAASWQKG